MASLAPFHGWRRSAALSNGLVKASVVPQVAGRTLEYALGGYNFLFLGRSELGKTFQQGGEPRYQHFGGAFIQLHPEDRWLTLLSDRLPELFTGSYKLHFPPQAEGGGAVLELESPPDMAANARLARRIELFPGASRMRITDTLTNLRLVPLEWGLQAMLQLKGAPEPSGVLRRGEAARGDIALYVPLNPKSRLKGGVEYVVGGRATPRGASQWSTAELPGLLVLRYRGELGKAIVDPDLPWVAFVDHASGHAFVQVCSVPRKVIQSIGRSLAPYPFIEVQCFAPVRRIGPGESIALTQEWFATRCRGPVVDVTAAGIVASPLSLLRAEGRTWAAGTFGVFYAGTAELLLADADGAELARLDCGPVTPLAALELDRPIDLPPRTATIALIIRDPSGNPVGDLGKINLAAR